MASPGLRLAKRLAKRRSLTNHRSGRGKQSGTRFLSNVSATAIPPTIPARTTCRDRIRASCRTAGRLPRGIRIGTSRRNGRRSRENIFTSSPPRGASVATCRGCSTNSTTCRISASTPFISIRSTTRRRCTNTMPATTGTSTGRLARIQPATPRSSTPRTRSTPPRGNGRRRTSCS